MASVLKEACFRDEQAAYRATQIRAEQVQIEVTDKPRLILAVVPASLPN